MFQVIKQNILSFFYMYVGQGSKIAVFVLFFTLLFGGWYEKKYEGRNFFNRGICIKAVTAAILAMYLYIVIGITLLSRSEGYSSIVNLRLFSTFGSSFTDRMYIYENILLFVPLGILLFILAKPFRYLWISFLMGVFCSFAIEMTQILTHLGRFELDDILTNTMGMLIGFFVCKLMLFTFKRVYYVLSGGEWNAKEHVESQL